MGFAVPVLHVSCKVRDGGNPYEFGICASIRGQSMRVTGLSMGELVTINREIAGRLGRRSMRVLCRTVLRGLCVLAVLPVVLLTVGWCAFWDWLWRDDDERSRYGYGY